MKMDKEVPTKILWQELLSGHLSLVQRRIDWYRYETGEIVGEKGLGNARESGFRRTFS